MSIRPVDIQIAMPKAMETSRVAQNESTRPFVDQNQFAQQLQRQVQNEQQSVTQMNKTESENVDEDGRGNSGTFQRRKKRQKAEEPKKENEKKETRSGLLDIRL